MTPHQIIPILEGLVSYTISSGTAIQGSQSVADWVHMVKYLLKTEAYRGLTDLELELLPDVDEDGGVLASAAATHLIAALIECTSTIATDGEGHVTFANAATDTQSTTLGVDVAALVSVQDVATTGVSEFYPVIWLAGQSDDASVYSRTGINLDTDLTVTCDGNAGGSPATDFCRVWVLIRT